MECPSLGVLETCLHHVREGLTVVWCCQKGFGETCTHSTSVSRLEHQQSRANIKTVGHKEQADTNRPPVFKGFCPLEN